MGYALVIAGEITAFCKKQHKGILFILVAITWIIFAFNTNNPDLIAYKSQYYKNATHYSEPLYIALQSICLKSGLSFEAFLCIEAALGLGLTAIAIAMMSPYPNMVYGLYMIFPFFVDVVQVRSFFAQAFVLLSIASLLRFKEGYETKNIVLFFAWLLAAIGFHYSAILVAPLTVLLLDIKTHKILVFIIVPLIIIAIPVIAVAMYPVAVKVIGASKAVTWIGIRVSKGMLDITRTLVTRLALPVMLLLVWQMLYSGKKYTMTGGPLHNKTGIVIINEIKKDAYYSQNLTLLIAFIYLSLFVSLELFMDAQYSRLSRIATMVGVVLYSRLMKLIKTKANENILWGILVFIVLLNLFDAIMFRIKFISASSWFTDVFRVVFENNAIWN